MDRTEEDVVIACGLYMLHEEQTKKKFNIFHFIFEMKMYLKPIEITTFLAILSRAHVPSTNLLKSMGHLSQLVNFVKFRTWRQRPNC